MQKNILLPQVELEMESVTVVKVNVAEGDLVDAEKPIIEVETQKATIEVPASESGYVRKVYVKEGDTIGKEALLCVLTDQADESFTEPPRGSATPGEKKAAAITHAAAAVSAEGDGDPVVHAEGIVPAAPAARRLAKEMGVDLRRVRGTGPGGRVKVEDVHAMADRTKPQPVAASQTESRDWTPIPPTRLALIAQMQKSLAEIPQIHVARQMDVTSLSQKSEGATFTHRLIRAAAAALAKHAPLRTIIRGNQYKTEPVSVAVAMDTPYGLVAPAIRHADQLQLPKISAAMEDFRKRGGANALKRDEMIDAPFAITNLGMFGVDFFNAFVFHGQTAVLAVARAVEAAAGRKVAWFSLAVDHRIVDGAEAARFLETLQQEISRP